MSVDYSQGSAVPPVPPQKKGMGPLGWIAIGCGVIIVLCIIGFGIVGYIAKRGLEKFQKNPAMAMAQGVVAMNPDLETVSKDESAGTITVRNKKTGETVTANLDDIKNGKMTFKSDKGTMTIDGTNKDGAGVFKVTDEKGRETVVAGGGAPKNLPSWLPNYPGGTTQGNLDTNNDEGHSGAFTVSTKDPVAQVMGFYETQLKSAGLKVEKTTYNAQGKDGGTVTGKSEDGKKEANVILSTDDNGTSSAIVTFADKH